MKRGDLLFFGGLTMGLGIGLDWLPLRLFFLLLATLCALALERQRRRPATTEKVT